MRLIAERLLPKSMHGQTYLEGELVTQRPTIAPPSQSKRYHLFVSPHNRGAMELVKEVQDALRWHHQLRVTDDLEAMSECERMLLYLTAQTWTGSEDTVSRLTMDVASAMALGVEIFLVHEVPGDDTFAGADVDLGTFGDRHGVVLAGPVELVPGLADSGTGSPRLGPRDEHNLRAPGLNVQARLVDQCLRHVAADAGVARLGTLGPNTLCQ